MADVTIPGTGVGTVNEIIVTTTATSSILQNAAQAIASLIAANVTTGNATGVTGNVWPEILSIGGRVPGGYGPMTVSGIGSNVRGVLINDTDAVVASNATMTSQETVIAGIGNLTFTDNGSNDQIFVGGGTNNITFNTYSYDSAFEGDGSNQITVNAAQGTTTIFGTAGSSDTIVGGSGSGGIYYVETAGSMALITPNSHNVTVVGTAAGGATSIFGTNFTGSLYVSGGTGTFTGGTNTSNPAGTTNALGSSAAGGTTLIGGGAGDVLTSLGVGDVMRAGLGAETLNGAGALGGGSIYGSAFGSQVIFAGSTTGDVIYTTNSTTSGSYTSGGNTITFTGEFINLHTAPGGQIDGNGVTGRNTIMGGAVGNGVQNATINDFISGTDKLVLTSAVTGLGVSTVTNPTTNVTTVTTQNGSTFTFLNTSVLHAGDVTYK